MRERDTMTGRDSTAIKVGGRKQLFIDHKFIEKHVGITLRMNPPVKAEAVLVPETAWEARSIFNYANVIRADGEYRMYYKITFPAERSMGQIMNGSADSGDKTVHALCLAVSDDGIVWRRPRVGRFDLFGTTDNNIVMPGAGEGGVFVDPRETDGFPYWYFGRMQENPWWEGAAGATDTWFPIEGGLYLARSKDGMGWERVPGCAFPFLCDSHNQAFFDTRLGTYVFYVRGWELPDAVGGYGRVVCRGRTDRLADLPWPFTPDPNRSTGPRGMYGAVHTELPIVMRCDELDPPITDLYNPCVHQYAQADDAYLAFPSPYRHYEDPFDSGGRDHRGRAVVANNDGPLDVSLAVGRDGVTWSRFRQPYVPLGRIGDPDGGQLYMAVGMAVQDEEIWQYTASTLETHGNISPQTGPQKTAITRLVQRLDGFVSADAEGQGSEITTPVLTFEGNRLELNVNCSAMGEAWVELQNPQGRPVPGFSMNDSVSVDRNGVRQEVWWKGGPDVSSLVGKPVRLHIKMRWAKLYAFQFLTR